MLPKIFSILALLVFISVGSKAQLDQNSLQKFNNVEFYLFNGQYKEAYAICYELIENNASNKLLNFHMGLCCSNIKGRKAEAIVYFRNSFVTKDSSSKAEISSIYIYMGKDHSINVNDNIGELNTIDSVSFGFKLDPKKPYSNICISDNGQYLLFINADASKNRVLYTQKEKNIWKEPVDVTSQVGSEGDYFPSCISNDGKRAYFTRYNSFESEIYVSSFNGKIWSSLKKLNSHINSIYWDAHAFESIDGRILYFTSNRPGGFGGMDIYYSIKVNNDWGKPVNSGGRINTFLNEDYPILANGDKNLLFSSQGIKKGKDGFDLYCCNAMGENQWSAPENMGYPINTEEDDYTYVPLIDASRAFFSMIYGMSTGRSTNDTYQEINLLNIRGTVKNNEEAIMAGKGKITVTDLLLNKDIKTLEPDPGGKYNFLVREGEYKISYNCPGYEPQMQNILIPYLVRDDTLLVNVTLVKSEKSPVGQDSNIWRPQ